MSRKQAAETTLEEYELKLKGYYFSKRTDWEIARWEQWYQVQYASVKKKPKKLTDVTRFDWDQDEYENLKPEDCKVTKEEADALTATMKRIFKL